MPDLPIVLASSVSQHDVAADPRWPAAGIGAVVMKPIKASPLHGALATVLGASLDDAEAGHDERARRDARAPRIRCGSCWPRTTS